MGRKLNTGLSLNRRPTVVDTGSVNQRFSVSLLALRRSTGSDPGGKIEPMGPSPAATHVNAKAAVKSCTTPAGHGPLRRTMAGAQRPDSQNSHRIVGTDGGMCSLDGNLCGNVPYA